MAGKSVRTLLVWVGVFLLPGLVVSTCVSVLRLFCPPSRAEVRQAHAEFVAARPKGLSEDSAEFAFFGLKGGETIAQVDAVMHAAARRTVGEVEGASPAGGGQLRVYMFEYGPEVKECFSQERVPAARESIVVLFSPEGYATRVERVYEAAGLSSKAVFDEYDLPCKPAESQPSTKSDVVLQEEQENGAGDAEGRG